MSRPKNVISLNMQQLNGYSEKEMFAIFKTKLQGPALHFYLDSQINCQTKKLTDIRNEFTKFFSSQENKNIAFRSLDKLKMESNESVRNFSYRLNKNLKLAHPAVDDAALQILKFSYFMNAMPKNIHVKLLEENITDFENALTRAKQLQSIYNHTLSPISDTQPRFPVYNMEQLDDSTSPFSPQHQHMYQNKGRNFQNKKFSHEKDHRQQNSNNFKFRRPFYKQNLYNSNRIRQCAFCGRNGHLMKSCFQFKNFVQNMHQPHFFKDGMNQLPPGRDVNVIQPTFPESQTNQQRLPQSQDNFSRDNNFLN